MFSVGSPQQRDTDPARLFEEILSEIPGGVQRVCNKVGHRPDQMEFEALFSRAIYYRLITTVTTLPTTHV